MKKGCGTESAIAYLALGANLGDRLAQLQGARAALEAAGRVRVTAASSLYETEPVGGPSGQPTYLNAVLRTETVLSPRELLDLCLSVEARFGRLRSEAWGPRTLDIDILFCGGKIIVKPELVVPHPRLHERCFVLMPLADLAPDLLHPLLGRSVLQLLTDLGNREEVRLVKEKW